MSGSGRDWGTGGPVRLQQREKFSLQVVSGLRLPRGASCDLGSRCWPVGTTQEVGTECGGKEQLYLMVQKWAVGRMKVKQGSKDSQTWLFFFPVSTGVEFSWDGKEFMANGHMCALSPKRR